MNTWYASWIKHQVDSKLNSISKLNGMKTTYNFEMCTK